MAKNNKTSKHITLATLGVLARCYNCTIKRDGHRYKMYHKSGEYIAAFNAKYMYAYGYAVLNLERTYSLKRLNQHLFKHFANTRY